MNVLSNIITLDEQVISIQLKLEPILTVSRWEKRES